MTNRSSLLLLMAAIGTMVLAGCGGKKNQQSVPEDEEVNEPIVWQSEDSTVYGLCGDGSAMNTLQLITDTGDTLNLSVAEAKDQNHVLGGYNVGDRMAVLTNRERTMATLVINESALLGNCGVCESIEQTSIIYRTWRITNGMLELVSIREGGVEAEETNLYEILSLGNDSLVYKTVGKPREEEETFEYSRQVIRKREDKVKLEEASYEDFKI